MFSRHLVAKKSYQKRLYLSDYLIEFTQWAGAVLIAAAVGSVLILTVVTCWKSILA